MDLAASHRPSVTDLRLPGAELSLAASLHACATMPGQAPAPGGYAPPPMGQQPPAYGQPPAGYQPQQQPAPQGYQPQQQPAPGVRRPIS